MSEYITFRVARQDFAIESSRVLGLLPLYDMLPLDPPKGWVLGIASIRGMDFPVVDVRGKLGIAPGSPGRQPCIIAVEVPSPHGPQMVGFIADRISGVIVLRNHEIQDGVVRSHGRPRRIFDPGALAGETIPIADVSD